MHKLTGAENWALQRRFTTAIVSSAHKAAFYGYPELESKRLLKELLDDPAAYHTGCENYISRTTCRLAWGTSDASDEVCTYYHGLHHRLH